MVNTAGAGADVRVEMGDNAGVEVGVRWPVLMLMQLVMVLV